MTDSEGDQRAHRRRAEAGDRQRARHGGEREAAIWIGRRAKIVGKQAQLVVARGLQRELVEQRGEMVHAEASADSSSPSP